MTSRREQDADETQWSINLNDVSSVSGGLRVNEDITHIDDDSGV